MKPKQKETSSQKRRRETAEKRIYPLGMGNRLLEQSECADLEEWQESLFRTATEFTVNILTGSGVHEREVHRFKTFPKAIEKAAEMIGHRILVYAINPQGRFFNVPPNLWARYRQIWDQMHPKFQDQVFKLIEGHYCIKGGKVYGPFKTSAEALERSHKR